MRHRKIVEKSQLGIFIIKNRTWQNFVNAFKRTGWSSARLLVSSFKMRRTGSKVQRLVIVARQTNSNFKKGGLIPEFLVRIVHLKIWFVMVRMSTVLAVPIDRIFAKSAARSTRAMPVLLIPS